MVVLRSSQILPITAHRILDVVLCVGDSHKLFLNYLWSGCLHSSAELSIGGRLCPACVSGYEWLDPVLADGWKAMLRSNIVPPSLFCCPATGGRLGVEKTRWLICLLCSQQAVCRYILYRCNGWTLTNSALKTLTITSKMKWWSDVETTLTNYSKNMIKELWYFGQMCTFTRYPRTKFNWTY